MNDHDFTEKVERTDTGFRFYVKSTRGSDTRDVDEVKAELRSETIPDDDEMLRLREMVDAEMEHRRSHPTRR